jgi:hypothetical protein
MRRLDRLICVSKLNIIVGEFSSILGLSVGLLLLSFSMSGSQKKEGAGKPTPSVIDRVSGLDPLLREAGRVVNLTVPVNRYQRGAVIEAELEQLQSVIVIAPEVVLQDIRK